MIETIIGTAAEYVANLGVGAAKEKFKDKIDERKLKAALSEYIEHQRKYNEMCSLAEEINFRGLVEYIRDNLLDEIGIRIFDPNRKKRGLARQHIVDMACVYAKAETDAAKYRVSKCIAICLDIIHGFYAKDIKLKDYIMASEIVDAVGEDIVEAKDEIVKAVKSEAQSIVSTITNGSLFSIDKALQLVQEGQIDQVSEGFTTILRHISLKHPLYPDYGYNYERGHMVSVPLTERGRRLYPQRYKFTGAMKIGGQYYNDPNGNPMDYAYRHQLPIVMEVSKAVGYLGDVIDPVQGDIDKLVELRANPPEFPPAFACAIKVGEQTYFEYILLRVREILDDGKIVLNNEEQESHIRFGLVINPQQPDKPDFKISIKDADNKECLNYTKFMKALKEEKDIHIYVLEAGEDLIAGKINDFDLHTGFTSIDEEGDFLERLCSIEDYFGVTFKPEGNISINEYNAVMMISDLVRQNEVKRTWNDASFTGTLDQHFREEVLGMKDIEHEFSYVGTHEVDLFGAQFEFRFMRVLKDARFEDIEKLRKKVEVLDDGDSIKFTLIPGSDNTSIETLHIPEKFEVPA